MHRQLHCCHLAVPPARHHVNGWIEFGCIIGNSGIGNRHVDRATDLSVITDGQTGRNSRQIGRIGHEQQRIDCRLPFRTAYNDISVARNRSIKRQTARIDSQIAVNCAVNSCLTT